MINSSDRSGIDQANALVGELIPASCKSLLEGFLSQGFSREEALSFIRVWLAETIRTVRG